MSHLVKQLYFNCKSVYGDGIYFAENAAYSRNYSYQITQQDDPNHVRMKVMLCCLIQLVEQNRKNKILIQEGQVKDMILLQDRCQESLSCL
ncbi:unnamed protein product [Paramecium sonneborni]|uniref:PARP catalytic domain-containing protein n=1 Tax=Paramecium sonneborni TaxID=65129 RepID=A0A8S1RSV2_9CILI|nr:unnamed protein product [Paramecium sonneborni]